MSATPEDECMAHEAAGDGTCKQCGRRINGLPAPRTLANGQPEW